MKQEIRVENWKLAWIENAIVNEKNICLKTPADVQAGGYKTITASVPGNFELDFMRASIFPF